LEKRAPACRNFFSLTAEGRYPKYNSVPLRSPYKRLSYQSFTKQQKTATKARKIDKVKIKIWQPVQNELFGLPVDTPFSLLLLSLPFAPSSLATTKKFIG